MYLVKGGWKNETARRFHALFSHPLWNIGIVEKPIQAFLEPERIGEVHWLPPLPRGRYLADPFGVLRGGKTHVLCEELDYRTNKGIIVTFQLSDGFVPSTREPVIVEPTHLSYPYLIEDGGRLFCVPENFSTTEISLYTTDEFPRGWRRVAVLIQGVRAHDSQVFHHDGRWWLCYTDVDKGPFDKLFLWHSEHLTGPWRPHARNPVKTDAKSARGAGTPFLHRGQLYRPAQDCSRTYGRRIMINRVLTLTPSEFEEETAAVVGPLRRGPYRDGIHTLSGVGNMTLVDGYRVTFDKSEFGRALDSERRRFLGALTPLWHRS